MCSVAYEGESGWKSDQSTGFPQGNTLKLSGEKACAFKNTLAKGYLFFAGNLEAVWLLATSFWVRPASPRSLLHVVGLDVSDVVQRLARLPEPGCFPAAFPWLPPCRAILQQPLGALLCFYFWELMCFCFALIAQFPTGDSTALFKMLVIFKELFLSCHPKSYIVQQQAASINHWFLFFFSFPSFLSLFQACGFGRLGKRSLFFFCLDLAYSKCHVVTARVQIVIAEHRCRILFSVITF